MERTWPWKDPETSSLGKASSKCKVLRAKVTFLETEIMPLGLKCNEEEEERSWERIREGGMEPTLHSLVIGERLCITLKCNGHQWRALSK